MLSNELYVRAELRRVPEERYRAGSRPAREVAIRATTRRTRGR